MYNFICISLVLIPSAFGYLKAPPVRHFNGVSSPIKQSVTPVGQKLPLLGSSRNQVPTSPSTDFQYLKKLDARVKRLSDGESDYLLSFWSDTLKCFQIYPNMSTTRVSITTTCMAIGAILANPSHWERSCRWDAIIGSSGPDGLGGTYVLLVLATNFHVLLLFMCYYHSCPYHVEVEYDIVLYR